jgi:stage IV sporulation protein B
MQKGYKVFASAVSLAVMGVLSLALYYQLNLPNQFYVVQGERFVLQSGFGIRATGIADRVPLEVYSRSGNSYKVNLKVFGGINVKAVDVQVIERDTVIPGGNPFGIKMFTKGVMVVGTSDIDVGGKMANPAKECGIRVGDMILSINDEAVEMNEDLSKIISESGGRAMEVLIRRKEVEFKVVLTPVLSPLDNSFKAGVWVRDSSAGIGTLTYYDPLTGIFAGLGHGVCDVDTGNLMPLSKGEAVNVTITGVTKGAAGFPGELRGVFSSQKAMGVLIENSESGVFGSTTVFPALHEAVPVALKHEVKEGEAYIYTTINGNQPQKYTILIEKVNLTDAHPTKNMVIRITDEALLAVTGGIVQGMSGSPILQNGYLVGAVTHVFVNDPTRGYGIFAENMQAVAQRAARPLQSVS